MIRPAAPNDVDRLVELEELCLTVDAWPHALVAEGVAGLPTVTWTVAEVDGAVVGYAVTSVAGDIAELQRIAVDPGHRRGGLARALLDDVRRLGRAGGADRLLLEVREDNEPAIAFYADRGFVEIDRRRRYYRDGATAIVMRLPLVSGCG